MAHYFIFPEADTTLYSHPDRSTMNAGHDEILELVEEKATTGNTYYPSRILIKFKNCRAALFVFARFNNMPCC